MADKKKNKSKSGYLSTNALIAQNKRARYDYEIEEEFEAGIMLQGSEVKSLRMGRASINESYAGEVKGEMFLLNAHIDPYEQSGKHLQHAPRRDRKLLLHKREANRLMGSVQKKGYTIVPIKLFFDARGMVKLLIGLGKGKKLHDKRDTEKDRDWQRQKSRIMKNDT